jgi:uncharacterized SAM-dependent methyltransferase
MCIDAKKNDSHRLAHIHKEVSIKYDQKMINNLASESGLEIAHQYFDGKHYFSDVVFIKR